MKTCWKYLLLFVFGWPIITDGAKFRCDYKYCNYCKVWFKYHVIPVTWREAQKMCTFEGGILASPTTPEIRATMIRSTGTFPIFTGIHSLFSKGNYFTIDGIPLDDLQQRWATVEPDNAQNNESCLALNSLGEFLDVSCDEPRPYMCYRSVIQEINECGTYDPEYKLDTRTGHCYKFHTIQRNYEHAHFVCAAEGGHLAIINSDEEANVLRDVFKKISANMIMGRFWKEVALIGFHNWGEDNDWRTIHGQTLKEAGYDKWGAGQPSNITAGEYCGTIYRTALLNNADCKNHYAFICEKRPDFPSVCDNDKDASLGRQSFDQALDMLEAARRNH